MLATVFADGRARQAFSVYKTLQFASMAAGFAYAGYLDMRAQVSLLGAMAVLGVACFSVVDRKYRREERRRRSGEKEKEDDSSLSGTASSLSVQTTLSSKADLGVA